VRPRPILPALAAVLLVACSGGDASPTPTDLTVFSAASLADVLDQIETAYEAAVPGMALTIATDSSAALATQILEGAPADVFLAADTANPQRLVEAGLADGGATVFAANALAIITPIDDPGGLTTPFDLGRDGVRVIAAGDEVPITRYADELVRNLAASAGAPPDFAAAYAANIVSREDNVAAVRTKIELGEGDAAIVYVTDAAASDRIAAIALPDTVNVRADYAGVVVAASADPVGAHAFLDWLVAPDGQAILASAGFLPPRSP
jgi:molybdate transport system substrate-binding protein